MNKSLEYMIERSKMKSSGDIPEDNWDEANILNSWDMYRRLFQEDVSKLFDEHLKVNLDLCNEEDRYSIEISYSPNADFNYFTSTVTTHDGTMIFTENAISEVLKRLLYLGTYHRKSISDEVMANFADYTMVYDIGDVVINNDFGIKDINGHKMSGQTSWVCLPIKFSVRKK